MWMNLENVMISERNKSQRPHIICFHLYKIYTGTFARDIRKYKEIGSHGCLGKEGGAEKQQVKSRVSF